MTIFLLSFTKAAYILLIVAAGYFAFRTTKRAMKIVAVIIGLALLLTPVGYIYVMNQTTIQYSMVQQGETEITNRSKIIFDGETVLLEVDDISYLAGEGAGYYFSKITSDDEIFLLFSKDSGGSAGYKAVSIIELNTTPSYLSKEDKTSFLACYVSIDKDSTLTLTDNNEDCIEFPRYQNKVILETFNLHDFNSIPLDTKEIPSSE